MAPSPGAPSRSTTRRRYRRGRRRRRRCSRSPPGLRSPRRGARRPVRARSVIGVHTSANWIHPPNAASTVSTRDRHPHRPVDQPIVGRMGRMLLHVRGLLAAEDDEQHPERVEAGEERAGDAGREQDVPEPVLAPERCGEDRVLGEEPGERRHPGEREPADQHRPPRLRHQPPQAAHLSDVLLPAQRVDDDPCAEEEQRLEERVRHQQEHRVRVGADPCAEEHVADLRHRRVGDHPLDVRLDERDQPGHQQRQCAEHGRACPARSAPARTAGACGRSGRRRR